MPQDYPDVAPQNDDALSQISRLAIDMRQASRNVEQLEEQLKAAKEQLTQISEHDLPEAMAAVGMGEVKLSDGTKVTVKDNIFARITAENAIEAHAWLCDHGHGNLIKREFKIAFGRDQEEWAEKFQAGLTAQNVAYDRKQAVHSSTLKSFVKGQLEDGEEIPEELFGVHRQTVAKLT